MYVAWIWDAAHPKFTQRTWLQKGPLQARTALVLARRRTLKTLSGRNARSACGVHLKFKQLLIAGCGYTLVLSRSWHQGPVLSWAKQPSKMMNLTVKYAPQMSNSGHVPALDEWNTWFCSIPWSHFDWLLKYTYNYLLIIILLVPLYIVQHIFISMRFT